MATTHGLSHTRIYEIWCCMRKRCYNPNFIHYNNYGGRGIIIEFSSFEEFNLWAMQNGYTDILTIDRINTNGNYSAQNCRWISKADQMRNMRTNIRITHPQTKECLCLAEWSRKLGGCDSLVFRRINKHGWTLEEAITIPKGGKRILCH